jgi:rRNA-processing protein EBP2
LQALDQIRRAPTTSIKRQRRHDTMVTKSKLKMALAGEKGVDFKKQHQKKVQKAAKKEKMKKEGKKKGKKTEDDWEDVPEESDGEDSEDGGAALDGEEGESEEEEGMKVRHKESALVPYVV